MPSRTPIRNRLAKPLPARWREWLVTRGVPKRKYTAVCRATLGDGTVFDEVVIEEGWVIAVGLGVLTDSFEQRIAFDPEQVAAMSVGQIV